MKQGENQIKGINATTVETTGSTISPEAQVLAVTIFITSAVAEMQEANKAAATKAPGWQEKLRNAGTYLSVLIPLIFFLLMYSCRGDDPQPDPKQKPKLDPVVSKPMYLNLKVVQDFLTNYQVISDSLKVNSKKRAYNTVLNDINVPDSASLDYITKLMTLMSDSVTIDWKAFGIVTRAGKDTLIVNPLSYDAARRPLVKDTIFARNTDLAAQLAGMGVNPGLIKILPTQKPAEQQPGNYTLNSGIDLVNILAGIATDKKNNNKFTVNVSSGAISLLNDDQVKQLFQLLAYKSDPLATFKGNLTIASSVARLMLPESYVSVLADFGGKVGENGTNTFHVPVISDVALVQSVLTGNAYFSTNRGQDFSGGSKLRADTMDIINSITGYPDKIAYMTNGDRKYVVVSKGGRVDVVNDAVLQHTLEKYLENGTVKYPNPNIKIIDSNGNISTLPVDKFMVSQVDYGANLGVVGRLLGQMMIGNKTSVQLTANANKNLEFQSPDANNTINWRANQIVSDNESGAGVVKTRLIAADCFELRKAMGQPFLDSSGNPVNLTFQLGSYTIVLPDDRGMPSGLTEDEQMNWRWNVYMRLFSANSIDISSYPSTGTPGFPLYFITESQAKALGKSVIRMPTVPTQPTAQVIQSNKTGEPSLALWEHIATGWSIDRNIEKNATERTQRGIDRILGTNPIKKRKELYPLSAYVPPERGIGARGIPEIVDRVQSQQNLTAARFEKVNRQKLRV